MATASTTYPAPTGVSATPPGHSSLPEAGSGNPWPLARLADIGQAIWPYRPGGPARRTNHTGLVACGYLHATGLPRPSHPDLTGEAQYLLALLAQLPRDPWR